MRGREKERLKQPRELTCERERGRPRKTLESAQSPLVRRNGSSPKLSQLNSSIVGWDGVALKSGLIVHSFFAYITISTSPVINRLQPCRNSWGDYCFTETVVSLLSLPVNIIIILIRVATNNRRYYIIIRAECVKGPLITYDVFKFSKA